MLTTVVVNGAVEAAAVLIMDLKDIQTGAVAVLELYVIVDVHVIVHLTVVMVHQDSLVEFMTAQDLGQYQQ